ncbi:MAG: C69 family dipeptidase [Bacteroidetes bacterium]|nr:C69 family dipeptidase [Bacteroidota bacterium]
MKPYLQTILATVLVATALFIATPTKACTNLLVTKGATTDGSTFISYNADSHTLYGELYYWAAASHPKGSMLDVYDWDTNEFLGKIKQVPQTYKVVGNMNEYQVAIGETTYGGREELQKQPGAVVDYGSLIYIALQRSKTAREAIKVMTNLVAEYGYASEGESFSVSDVNEVWIFEMIGKGVGEKGAVWVARRIPDGYISGHANHARITTFPLNDPENCLYAPDVITFAKKKGYYKGADADFSFSDTYAPVDFSAARYSEARVWSMFNRLNHEAMVPYLDYAMGKNLSNRMPLWIKPTQKVSVHDVMEIMRDHYENTPMDMTKDMGAGPYDLPYRWRPLSWKVDGVEYLNERAVSTQQTGFSFVAQSRGWLPNTLGGIIWFGVDDTYSTVYTPMYTNISSAPENLKAGNGAMMKFSETSMFWIFNQVANFAYTRYRDMIPEIRARQAQLENKYIALVAENDTKYLQLAKQNPKATVQALTAFSHAQSRNTFTTWKSLYQDLFVKYMDGNIKTVIEGKRDPKVSQPGYGDAWYRKIVTETGDRLKVLK